MIDGKEILSRLGKLRDVTCSKDIAQLTYAMFPGTHCPLMGAAMAVRGIQRRGFVGRGDRRMRLLHQTHDHPLG